MAAPSPPRARAGATSPPFPRTADLHPSTLLHHPSIQIESARALCAVAPHPHLARLLDVFVEEAGHGGGGGGSVASSGAAPSSSSAAASDATASGGSASSAAAAAAGAPPSSAHHPHLVMVWELVRGPDLLGLIACGPGRRLPEPLAAALVAQLASGLSAMHAAGLAHRDVKPENAVLDAETGCVKVIDFGLAAAIGGGGGGGGGGSGGSGGLGGWTAPACLGTPAYMPPEAVPLASTSGRRSSSSAPAADAPPRPIDGAAADAWGLGAVLYACVTGALPFVDPAHPGSAHHTLAAVSAAVNGPRPAPLDRAGVSPGCRSLIAALLARDPDARLRVGAVPSHPWMVEMGGRRAEAAAAQASALAAHAAEWGGFGEEAGAVAAAPGPADRPLVARRPRRPSLEGEPEEEEAGAGPLPPPSAAATPAPSALASGLPPRPGTPLKSVASAPPAAYAAGVAGAAGGGPSPPAPAPFSRASSAGGAVEELLGCPAGLQAWLSDLATAGGGLGGLGVGGAATVSASSEPDGWAARSPALPRLASAGVGPDGLRRGRTTSSASEPGGVATASPPSPPALTPSGSEDSLPALGGGAPSSAASSDAGGAAAMAMAMLPAPPASPAPLPPPPADDSFYHPYGSGSSGGGELEDDDWDDPWLHGDDLAEEEAAGGHGCHGHGHGHALLGTGPWSGGGCGRPQQQPHDSPPVSGASAWSAASLASAVSQYSHGDDGQQGPAVAAVAPAAAAAAPAPPAAAPSPRAALLAALAKPSPSSVSEAVAALRAATTAAGSGQGGPPCLLREYLARRRGAAAAAAASAAAAAAAASAPCSATPSRAASLSGSQRSLSGLGRPPAAPSPKRPAGRLSGAGAGAGAAEPRGLRARSLAPCRAAKAVAPAAGGGARRQALFKIDHVPSE